MHVRSHPFTGFLWSICGPFAISPGHWYVRWINDAPSYRPREYRQAPGNRPPYEGERHRRAGARLARSAGTRPPLAGPVIVSGWGNGVMRSCGRNFPHKRAKASLKNWRSTQSKVQIVKAIKIGARLHARYNAEPGEPSGWFAAVVINKRMVSGEPSYLVRWEDNIERWLTEKDLRP